MSFKIVALSGSLRKASTNTALIRAIAAQGLLPDDVELVLHDHADLPLYNTDLETEDLHPAVASLRAAIDGADGLLIVTPEYNHSIPGVLKNALDWASRPAFQGVLAGTPTAMMTVAPGAVGGARAHQHLKPILLAAMAWVFPGPEVCVNHSGDKLDDDTLTHEPTQKFIAQYLADFVAWAKVQQTIA